MRVIMIGPFGLSVKATMKVRALPLARALAARGHQVTMLLPPWDCPQDSGKVWTDEGVSVENIVLPPPVPLLYHLLIVARLASRVLALQPDVVHCFKPKAYAGLTAWALWQLKRWRGRLRLVMDSDDWEGFGGWNDLQTYSWMQRQVFAWQERWGLRHADSLTLASRALETIAWSLGISPQQIWYVPNGVNTRQVKSSEHTVNPQQTVFLYTRFFEFNLERVVDVFQQVHAARPDVRFLIVGKGLFGEQDRFLELCREAGLASVVEYVGWVEAEALPDYFARATVAVYPFDDTLVNRTKCSVKLLELLAAGVPVVAEAVGQNAATIEHGASGLLAGPDNTRAMAAAVLAVLDDPSLAKRLGQGAQQRILGHLTWEQLVEQVEEAYGV